MTRRNSRRRSLVWGGALFLVAAAGAAVVATTRTATAMAVETATGLQVSNACGALAQLQLVNTAVSAATLVEAGRFTAPATGRGATAAGAPSTRAFLDAPAFCRVELQLTPAAGADIRSEVWLPAAGWNGEFQAVGNRGWGGTIMYAPMATAIAAGYAAASTDTGHRGGGAAFALGNYEALVDVGHRAVHETTVASKVVIDRYYGRAPAASYWNGCSLGGRQGLVEVQRYPADYDGAVVGDPVHNLSGLYSARVAIARLVHRSSTSAIPPAKLPALHTAVLAACDRIDGVADDVVEDPAQCRFDPATIACTGGETDSCLTEEQVATAQALYAPVVHPRTGVVLSAGLPRGSEAGWGAVAGPQPENNSLGMFKFMVFGNPEWDWRAGDFGDAIDRATAVVGPLADAVDPDIRPFISRGGKLLMYHGWADPQTSAGNSIAYYHAATERVGARMANDGLRLFMVPGMGHCSGGTGTDTFDMMAPLERWIEEGVALQSIPASRVVEGSVVRTRPLCSFGSVARFTGNGAPDLASSFACTPNRPERESER